ncbi:MAG: glutamine--tRNA ligase/YqeY domain fusion protein [Chloroflexota bacterium]
MSTTETAGSSNFIRKAIDEDNALGRFEGRVHTRFPPEPNGYLHIGHAKAILLDFGLAEEYGGLCNLRFDDTNPSKENTEFVEGIKHDLKWLGCDWGDREFFASDYFEQLHDYAIQLIKKGKAYVDSLSGDEIREHRGTLTAPGINSPYRDRSIEENLDLFARMKAGEFGEGEHVLRAKIDMASPNLNLRDPVMYRVLNDSHHRTGDAWSIYPMYDFAHGQSDSLEGVTHSLCTIEYEAHRPLYDWFLDELDLYHPQQIEFAPLNLSYTILSKRKLSRLVDEGHVTGWDDPRMPTLAGLRRRGYTPDIIREFIDRVGVAKKDNSIVDMALLEHTVRESLNKTAPRVMAVLDPIKVVIDNYPEGQVEEIEAENNPEDENAGSRVIPFSREIYIEREDFREEAPRKFFRMVPGREVRLKHAYYVHCTHVEKDEAGEITEIHCTYDPATRGGWSDDGRKVKGTLHWVSAAEALDAEIRLYDHLFNVIDPEGKDGDEDFTTNLNPESYIVTQAKIEPTLDDVKSGERFQFLRKGYFAVDPDSSPNQPIFNRTVALRDSWAKIEKKGS